MSSTISTLSTTSPLNATTTTNGTSTSSSTSAPTTQIGANANNPEMHQFLTLLVAQLQNQNPMQPTDPTQFVAQLAQFSTVEQLVQGNTTLTGISQDITGLSLGQYAGLINHTVTATASTVTTPVSSSTPQNLNYQVTASGLSKVTIDITNSSGTVVRAIPVTSTTGNITWDGNDGNGNPLPAGQYSVSLVGTSTSASTLGQEQSAGTLTTSGTVASVAQSSTGTWQLQLTNGQTVTASSVTTVQ
jgi:flagellar basal-body rod modification protein FlgD